MKNIVYWHFLVGVGELTHERMEIRMWGMIRVVEK